MMRGKYQQHSHDITYDAQSNNLGNCFIIYYQVGHICWRATLIVRQQIKQRLSDVTAINLYAKLFNLVEIDLNNVNGYRA